MANFSKNKKYFAIVILLALFVIPTFASAAWWNPFSWNIWQKIADLFYKPQIVQVQQQKKAEEKKTDEAKVDETANWKTYKNTEYGFEIKYPENGNVKTGYDWVPNFWPPQIKVVSISEDVVRACPISSGGYYDQLASSKRFVEINEFGNPVILYKLSYNGTRSGSLRYCYIAKSTKTENYILYFEFTSTTDVDHKLEKDVDAMTQKILSTFKFTK